MIQRKAAVEFITYIISPAGGSTKINKRCKGKTRLDKNKTDTIAGIAAGGDLCYFIRSARQPGNKNNQRAARVT